MADRHDAERSVAQARARVTAIAEELSRRASGDYVKDRARGRADEYKARAKVMARERTMEMRDRFLDSPWALGLIGGVVGAVAGRMLGDRARERIHRGDGRYGRYERYDFDRPYDEYTATHAPAEGTILRDESQYETRDWNPEAALRDEDEGGRMDAVKERVGEVGTKVRERASGIGERARHMAHSVRDHMPDVRQMGHGMRERIPSRHEWGGYMHRVRGTADNHPGIWAIAAMAAGAFFGAVVPISNRERRYLVQARSTAEDRIRDVKDQVTEGAEALKHGFKQGMGMDEGGSENRGDLNVGGGIGGGGIGASSGVDLGGDVRSTGVEATSAPTTGGTTTYSAGGSSEDQQRNEGFQPISTPDVTRH